MQKKCVIMWFLSRVCLVQVFKMVSGNTVEESDRLSVLLMKCFFFCLKDKKYQNCPSVTVKRERSESESAITLRE